MADLARLSINQATTREQHSLAEVAAKSDDHIEEVIALETKSLTSIHGRLLKLTESFLEFTDGVDEIIPWVDVAADT